MAQRAIQNLEGQHVLSARPDIPFILSLCQPTAEDWETRNLDVLLLLDQQHDQFRHREIPRLSPLDADRYITRS
jgi:hypothetical protein